MHSLNTDTFPIFSDTIYNLKLESDTEQTINIPAGATKVIFQYATNNASIFNTPTNLFVRIGNETTKSYIPNENILDGNGMSINPNDFAFKPVDTSISLISDGPLSIALLFFA